MGSTVMDDTYRLIELGLADHEYFQKYAKLQDRLASSSGSEQAVHTVAIEIGFRFCTLICFCRTPLSLASRSQISARIIV
jgi:hypothetical protein